MVRGKVREMAGAILPCHGVMGEMIEAWGRYGEGHTWRGVVGEGESVLTISLITYIYIYALTHIPTHLYIPHTLFTQMKISLHYFTH